jgi:hypothetical protein
MSYERDITNLLHLRHPCSRKCLHNGKICSNYENASLVLGSSLDGVLE